MAVLDDFVAGLALDGSQRLEVHLEFEDNTGGKKTVKYGAVFDTDEATTLANINAAIDAIEALLPLHTLRRAMFGQVVELSAGDAIDAEANVEERIVITLGRTGQSDIPVRIYSPAAATAGGTLITDKQVLDGTNTQFVAVKNLFDPAGAEVLKPISEGLIVTAESYRKAVYKPRGGWRGRKRTVHG